MGQRLQKGCPFDRQFHGLVAVTRGQNKRFRHPVSQARKDHCGTVGDYSTAGLGGKRIRSKFEALKPRKPPQKRGLTGPVSPRLGPGSWRQPCNWRLSNSTSSAIERSEILSSSILRTACMTVVWSRLPKRLPICGRLERGELLGEIHRHLARPGDRAGAPRRAHLGELDVVVRGDPLLDLVDRHLAVGLAQQVVQHVLRHLDGDLAADQLAVGDDPVQRALELADVGADLVRQELEHRDRHRHPRILRLGLQDRQSRSS